MNPAGRYMHEKSLSLSNHFFERIFYRGEVPQQALHSKKSIRTLLQNSNKYASRSGGTKNAQDTDNFLVTVYNC
jgi:hypothetical protein